MSRRKVVALLMGSPGLRRGDYQALVRAGVEQRCMEQDVDLWVYSGRNDWSTRGPQGLMYDFLPPDRVDGIVIVGAVIACFLDVNEVLAKLQQRCPVPTCSLGLRLDGVPSVLMSNRTGMAGVVRHIAVSHGRRKFAFVAGPRGQDESEERLAAARDALTELGIELPDEAVGHGNFSKESGALVTKELLQGLPALDALVAANDDMAVGGLEALAGQGRRCPDDVAVAGFDDSPSSRICNPSLTTVRQPIIQLGVQAADWIMAAWRGEACPPVAVLETEMVLRGSCGCDPLLGSKRDSREPLEPPDATHQRADMATMLANLLGSQRRSEVWAAELWQAVDAEGSGHTGSLRIVVRRLLDEASHPDAPVHDLQRIINYLRTARADVNTRVDLTDAYCGALTEVGEAMHRREIHWQLDEFFLKQEMRISCERVATSLSFESLRDALVRDLPRFSVQNAIISVFPPGDLGTLVPLVCLIEGDPVPVEARAFPASQLMPDGVAPTARRCSFAVMLLTFETEPLGVAMLELPVAEVYMQLRDQIGSAMKTIRLHETLMHQQQERLKLQAEVESQATAERLRTMGVIAGGVAHDLNNVLGPLVALPEAIRKDLTTNAADTTNVFADLDTLQEAAQRAAHTIRDLLTLGRTIDMPKRTLDLNRVLDAERRIWSQLATRSDHVRLHLELPNTPLFAQVSREHLVRAVSNLVVNAADAMTGPGQVVIRVRERKVSERLEGIEPVAPGHYAVIEVEDSGQGIPQENLSRILEPFFTSKQQTARGGTGLGLAIVRQIVGQCRGYVQVTSQVGVGSTFALYFPFVTRSQAMDSESAPPGSIRGGNERILVVDDERVQLRTAQRILRQLGYRVATAETGAAAIGLFEQCLTEDPFQLVILDMLMPGSLNGLATLQQLRQRLPSQKALLASGYAPEQMSREAIQNGVRWLAKPYDAAGLARAVRAALETQVEPMSRHPGVPNPRLGT